MATIDLPNPPGCIGRCPDNGLDVFLVRTLVKPSSVYTGVWEDDVTSISTDYSVAIQTTEADRWISSQFERHHRLWRTCADAVNFLLPCFVSRLPMQSELSI